MIAGILAHVDAGKTTLSESMLYLSGSIHRMGRVDNQDAFLDTYEIEKERGITVFSKQALLQLGEMQVTLLDTPGHVDFSAEMERTLQVLDLAILVISGADGVQGHTETLWRLLKRYKIPVFVFINKMDQAGTDRKKLLEDLQRHLSPHCLELITEDEEQRENLAVCDEQVLEQYLETGVLEQEQIRRMIAQRKVFPCFFGSALKLTGVAEFLKGLENCATCPVYGEEFAARVYKIARDEQGSRLTYLKVTGGALHVKDMVMTPQRHGRNDRGTDGTAEQLAEKVNQIRQYSGAKYEVLGTAEAGTICAVTGLTQTCPGEGLGQAGEGVLPLLEPILTYRVEFPTDVDPGVILGKLKQLEEEEPELHILWNEMTGEIQIQLMGEVQVEILKRTIADRFGIAVSFGAGRIVYKETICSRAYGVGHFEPLRHYAEVHLLLEPGECGSGIQCASSCSTDLLNRNYQHLVLTHLEEKEHIGVLTGAPVTDLRITLVAGRAHEKHTEGGDFRQATYRAVRQGLMQAECQLLEPYYHVRMELPEELIGRAMADITQMHGSFEAPEHRDGFATVEAGIPVRTMQDYQMVFTSYTKGRGRMFCELQGYYPCHNTQEVLKEISYDPESDTENPSGSVFCAHGAGFIVPWDQVPDYMHLECRYPELSGAAGGITGSDDGSEDGGLGSSYRAVTSENRRGTGRGASGGSRDGYADEKELQEIFARTYKTDPSSRNQQEKKWGSKRTGTGHPQLQADQTDVEKQAAHKRASVPVLLGSGKAQDQYLVVDGYNVIFAWEELKALAQENLDSARDLLIDELCNYQGYIQCRLIVVFDAYRVAGRPAVMQEHLNIHVVYTAEGETADQYIEKMAHEFGRKYDMTVVTSDGLEQITVTGQGCHLISAREFRTELMQTKEEIRKEHLEKQWTGHNYLFDHLPEDLQEYMEGVRLGKHIL